MRVGLSAGNADATVAAPLVTGLTNPVPIAVSPDGAVLVGDWGTGTVYRIAAA